MANVTNFPKAGDDKAVSLRNSEYARFDLAFAEALKEKHPEIWAKGGNVKGNAQFRILSRIAKQGGAPSTPAEEKAIRLREAWAARHYGNKRVPGVVAQIKWLVVGSLGEARMKALMNAEKDKNDGRSAEPGGPGVPGDAPAQQAGGGSDAASHGLLLRAAHVRAVRREARPNPATGTKRDVVIVSFVASTEDIDSHRSILTCDWDQDGRLARYLANPVVLWMHDRGMEPRPAIGHAENVRVESKRLLLDVVCDDTTAFDREIAEKLAKGVLRGGSVGFDPGVAEVRVINDEEIIVYSKNTLREFSIANVPSNAFTLSAPQRAIEATVREMARAAGGQVAIDERAVRERALTRSPSGAPSPASPPLPAPQPARHGATMDRITIDIDERAVRAKGDGMTCAVTCPHCKAGFDMSMKMMPMSAEKAAELDAAKTRAADLEKRHTVAEERLALVTSEKDAAEKRATALETRVASAEAALKTYRDARIAAEIDKRVGTKIEPQERADEIAIAEKLLADATPDPEKPGSTLGEKRWGERLAKIDGRRDLGLLGAPLSGGNQKPQSGAEPAQARSIIDEINALAAAQA